MARFKISFHLSGNEDAVKGVVREMLDGARFTEVEFQMDEVRGGPTEIRVPVLNDGTPRAGKFVGLQIPLKDGRSMAVDAYVFGEWAAHRLVLEYGMLSDRRWSVTHVPSGMCLQIHANLDEESVINVAAALRDQFPDGCILRRFENPQSDTGRRIIDTVRGVLWP